MQKTEESYDIKPYYANENGNQANLKSKTINKHSSDKRPQRLTLTQRIKHNNYANYA